jgi:hypothetical protein
MPTHARADKARAGRGLAEWLAKTDATDADVEEALGAIDQDAIYDAEAARWDVVVWDRVSPINGHPAAHFLARDDVGDDGDVYLLTYDGRVMVFQPHEPDLPGIVRIPRGKGRVRGRVHADKVVADRAQGAVLDEVRARIAAKRSTA